MPQHYLRTKGEETKNEDICLFAETTFRNQPRRFGIKVDDRRRHMYVIGKTGMGKTTMMENMVLGDIYKGHGVGIVDPHGDFAEKIIDFIPPNRINDVVYFNPGDVDNPIGFNVLEITSEEQKHLIAAGLMGIFKKIWPDVWSSRMEYILNNTILALLDFPGSTLLGINRLLADKDYRRKVVKQLKDPVIKAFWQSEFANYNDKYAQEAVAPIQNKIGQFLSASVIRNMVAQVKSTINVREIMDTQKIFIMNLSKGRIGEDNSRLLGGMLITKLQLAAMERVDTPEKDRKDFFLYVDEFQNFATPSFANILSEARKYRLSLIMAHQYVKQLDEIVADAVFGNVGTIAAFRVGGLDAEMLAKEFAPTFVEEDIVNLTKFQVILKLMIDGVASQPFSAHTIPPIGSRTGMAEKVIRVSRERYAKRREVIEDKIIRWSGMSPLQDDFDEDDAKFDEKISTTLEKVPGSVVIAKEPDRNISLKDLLPTNPIPDINKKIINTPTNSNPTENATIIPKQSQIYKAPAVTLPNSDNNPIQSDERKKRKRKRKRKSNSPMSSIPTAQNNSQITGNIPSYTAKQFNAIPPVNNPIIDNSKPPILASITEDNSPQPTPPKKDDATSKIEPDQIIKFD